ncbi:MAG: toprim domain-containing protein [Bacteroidota bacterium]
MDCKTAKRIDIVDYLLKNNISPVQINSGCAWYCSPFREEKTASFKVNRTLNAWYDHGAGKGGDIIRLVMLLWGYNESQALKILSNQDQIFKIFKNPVNNFPKENNNVHQAWTVKSEIPLEHTGLINYLTDRNINIEAAKKHCKTVYFTSNYRIQRGYPNLFAVGFKNDSGGYELSSYKNANTKERFKTCTSPKDITTIKANDNQGTSQAVIFEGFIDFLSCLTYKKQVSFENTDAIILNSLSYLGRAIKVAEKYKSVILLLDNDTAGKEAANKFIKSNSRAVNSSYKLFPGYKDFNDFLCFKNENI